MGNQQTHMGAMASVDTAVALTADETAAWAQFVAAALHRVGWPEAVSEADMVIVQMRRRVEMGGCSDHD